VTKAEIREGRSPRGRFSGYYDVVLEDDKGAIHYLRLKADELDAIWEAWGECRPAEQMTLEPT
jgi:hypothetical protein